VNSVGVFFAGLIPELGLPWYWDGGLIESYFLNECFAGEIAYLRASV